MIYYNKNTLNNIQCMFNYLCIVNNQQSKLSISLFNLDRRNPYTIRIFHHLYSNHIYFHRINSIFHYRVNNLVCIMYNIMYHLNNINNNLDYNFNMYQQIHLEHIIGSMPNKSHLMDCIVNNISDTNFFFKIYLYNLIIHLSM